MKLRHMSAEVENLKDVDIMAVKADGSDYKIHLESCIALRSYNSIVAIYSYGEIYLLPRYDYSVTTWRHVHAFIQDYCHDIIDGDCTAIREKAKCEDMGYHFASHYAYMNGLQAEKWSTY